MPLLNCIIFVLFCSISLLTSLLECVIMVSVIVKLDGDWVALIKKLQKAHGLKSVTATVKFCILKTVTN